MARRSSRAGRTVQVARDNHAPHTNVPSVRYFIDATSDPVSAATERAIYAGGRSDRKPHHLKLKHGDSNPLRYTGAAIRTRPQH